MERLTYFENGHWRLDFNGCQYRADFVDRLAAYEDTGLTPEQCENAKCIIEAAFSDDTSICMHGVYRHVTVTDDFFCGYGEKKDGDENGGVR